MYSGSVIRRSPSAIRRRVSSSLPCRPTRLLAMAATSRPCPPPLLRNLLQVDQLSEPV